MEDRPRPRILLLSAYRADSHAAWAHWLTRTFARFEWTVAELPGRYFRWRIRGNPLSWLDAAWPEPDAIVATSMVDLATLRGLRPELATARALYYFHENQFAYPLGERQKPYLEPQMVQLYGALAADQVVFNSRFNRDSFLDGVAELLRRMPDALPAGVPERIAGKSRVLPVPVRPIAPDPAARDPGLIVWNHRWEYDKGPDVFADAVLGLAARGADFRLALLGPRPAQAPEALERLRRRLGGRIVVDGRLPRAEYEATLARAGIVVSTALQEFQGLAVLEAVSAGATPLVPDALVYPEQVDAGFRYPAGDAGALTALLAEWLNGGAPPPPDVSAWTETALRDPWGEALESLAGSG